MKKSTEEIVKNGYPERTTPGGIVMEAVFQAFAIIVMTCVLIFVLAGTFAVVPKILTADFSLCK